MNNNLGIKELARLANVSIGTVDRVLHNRDGVSPATKEKVLKIVEETGYKKNVLASRLKLASIKAIKIAVLVPNTSNETEYWNLPVNGVNSAIEELKDLGVSTKTYHFELLNPETFRSKIDQILEEQFDALVTVPFFDTESNILLEKTRELKLPIVFIDTERHLNLPTNFINQNSINAGKVAGRLLHGLLGDDADYFVVNILNERGKQINNLQREEGFRSFFDQNFKNSQPKIHVINHPLEDDLVLPDNIRKIMQDGKPKGIFVANARSYYLLNILKEYDVSNARILGFDLNPQNVAKLKTGEIDFLINQKPHYQGYSAIKGLYKYLTEKDQSLLNLEIPIEIVVKENVDYYVNK